MTMLSYETCICPQCGIEHEELPTRAARPCRGCRGRQARRVASPVVSTTCAECDGLGYRRIWTGGHQSDWIALPCQTCGDAAAVR